MGRIEVYKNQRMGGCAWLLTIPVLLVGMLACGLAAISVSFASEFTGPEELKTDSYAYPVEGLTSAQITLAMDVADLRLTALDDSAELIEADITYIGDLRTATAGERDLQLSITQQNPGTRGLSRLLNVLGMLSWEEEVSVPWDVALRPDLPLALRVQGSAGRFTLDASALTLQDTSWQQDDAGSAALVITLSAGEMTLDLPPTTTGYHVVINHAVGSATINLPPEANVVLVADLDVGNITVNPNLLDSVTVDENDDIGDSGEWRSRDFDPAAPTITLLYTGGMGELIVR